MNILRKTKGLLLAAALIMLAGVRAIAQDVSFTAQAPQAVVVGERFRITYKVNTRDAKEFRAPDMKNIQILTGPATSTSSSTTIINGQRTDNTTITFTYTAVASEEGEVELDGATIKANGKQVTSNKLTIKVLPPDQVQQGAQGQGRPQTQGGQQSAQGSQAVGADDLFMLATVDTRLSAAP